MESSTMAKLIKYFPPKCCGRYMTLRSNRDTYGGLLFQCEKCKCLTNTRSYDLKIKSEGEIDA